MDIQRLSENRVKCTFTKDELLYNYGIDSSLPVEEFRKSFQENIHEIANDIIKELDLEIDGELKVIAKMMPAKDGNIDIFLSYTTEEMPVPPITPLDILSQIFGRVMQQNPNGASQLPNENAKTANELAKAFEGKKDVIGEKGVYKFRNIQSLTEFVNLIGKQKSDSMLYKKDDLYYLYLLNKTKALDAIASEYLANTENISDTFLTEHAELIIEKDAIDKLLSIS